MNNKYRSGLEAKVAANLKKSKIKFKYEPFKIPYKKKISRGYCRVCSSKDVETPHNYLPDFFLPDLDVTIEVKGKFTPDGRKKILSIIECNPELNLKMLFQRDNYLSKKHHTKYSDWCKRNKVDFYISSEGEVPKKWLN